MPGRMEGLAERPVPDTVIGPAAEWGKRRFRRDLYREREPGRGVIRVVARKTQEGPLKLPRLIELEESENSIRYDELGGVHIPFWKELEVMETEAGIRYIESPERLEQLRRPRERRVDFKALPKRKVVELVMARSPDIFTAIRQAGHVKDRYINLGEEAEQLDRIWTEITRIRDLILGRQINKESLGDLASQTASFLEGARLTFAKKNAKTNILTRLMGVYQEDTLGRINPLAELSRFRSAYLDAVSLEAFGVLVREKFTRIAGVLLMENVVIRQAMEDSVDALDTMMGFTKRGAWVFEGGRFQEGEAKGMNKVIKAIGPLLRRARLAPYLQGARAAEIALLGSEPEEEELNRQILGEELATELLSPDFVSVTRLIEQHKALQAKRSTQNWVVNPIQRLLAGTGFGFEDIG